MKYHVELKPTAIKDLKNIPEKEVARIIAQIESLEDDLKGDVKKLTNFTPEYRMRAGNYRALFEVSGDRIIVYRIKHRKDIYR
ncbi:MAG: type II toxin-antitoxin system RelE/ParE family toxin [Nitrospirae bacterium]|nr:type II toxin-antitoxin system RelE/ParE family toxin [Nitrospirota bacterium]MDA1303404.1 type II toxin-antitoxin system RelE/ParE family toxin [Nitrospirota bacterium]